jgi:hypothetical protein
VARPTSPSPSSPTPVDWLLRSRRTGRITVFQFPNLALWLFLAIVGIRLIVAATTAPHTAAAAHRAIDWAGNVVLGWWAADEVVRGVNPWRRLLGLAVGAVVAAGVVSLVR